ncbi:hypothetical protein XFF6166_10020 [Xanthomonas citri pv. fuscans]|nr:hypothetical protein XFF6166_10020 [Xanthomonas citri pv. fuscans]SOO02365.1 hypothetical protein XFF6960_590181 [Xanthomonas citri pv. fuscans]SOO06613.1 hypothetical protein XFF7767_80021 [Xanthomonas citri pv. fuscans]SOO11347.1 hypothetical protein XFF6970_760018 [Xanthomonas citri pv. fuscans]SOO16168.1 hypothetical protein XFF7766_770020 [Xanthomonas citri pv. fuscans]
MASRAAWVKEVGHAVRAVAYLRRIDCCCSMVGVWGFGAEAAKYSAEPAAWHRSQHLSLTSASFEHAVAGSCRRQP